MHWHKSQVTSMQSLSRSSPVDSQSTPQQVIRLTRCIGLEDGNVKLSYVVLSMQDLVFDHSDPDKKSGEGISAVIKNRANANPFAAMAYLVAILRELRKDVLSRADCTARIRQHKSLAN